MYLKTFGKLELEGLEYTNRTYLPLLAWLTLETAKEGKWCSSQEIKDIFYSADTNSDVEEGGKKKASQNLSLAIANFQETFVIDKKPLVLKKRIGKDNYFRSELPMDANQFIRHIERKDIEASLFLYEGRFLKNCEQNLSIFVDQDSFWSWLQRSREKFANTAFKEASYAARQAFDSHSALSNWFIDKALCAVRDIQRFKPENANDELSKTVEAFLHLLEDQAFDKFSYLEEALISKGYPLYKKINFTQSLSKVAAQPFTFQQAVYPRTDLINELRIDFFIDPLSKKSVEKSPRLLSITGMGGIGKTIFAQQLANAISSTKSVEDGTYWINLSHRKLLGHIYLEICEQLNLKVDDFDFKTAVQAYFRDKKALLLLDNLEQFIKQENQAELSEIFSELLQCRFLTIAVTSRKKLELNGIPEKNIVLGGLPFPTKDSPFEKAKNYHSLKLFEARARNVSTDFSINAKNYSSIRRFCEFVAGNPLAIELAARQMDIRRPHELNTELEALFHSLKTSSNVFESRHQSLELVLTSSWSSLNDDEKIALQVCSIFRGGFTAGALLQVTELSTSDSIKTLRSRGFFSEKSDVGVYDLHPIIREFASSLLEKRSDKSNDLYGKHAAYYCRIILLLNEERDLNNSESLAKVKADYLNLEAAWLWSVDNRDLNLIEKSGMFFRVCQRLSLIQQAALLCEAGLARLSDASENNTMRAVILLYLAELRLITGKVKDAEFMACQVEGMLPEEHYLCEIDLPFLKATLAMEMNNYKQALKGFKKVYRSLESKPELSRSPGLFVNLAVLEQKFGNFEQAEFFYKKGLQVCDARSRHAQVKILCNLGSLAFMRGLIQEAIDYYHKGLEASNEYMLDFICEIECGLAKAHLATNEFRLALDYCRSFQKAAKKNNFLALKIYSDVLESEILFSMRQKDAFDLLEYALGEAWRLNLNTTVCYGLLVWAKSIAIFDNKKNEQDFADLVLNIIIEHPSCDYHVAEQARNLLISKGAKNASQLALSDIDRLDWAISKVISGRYLLFDE